MPSLVGSEMCIRDSVGGTVTLYDVSFTTKIAIHSGGDAIAPYRCVVLLDTGSPQTFIRRDVLDRMLLVGAASAACQRSCSPRSWGGFGESPSLRTSTSIRLSVHFFRANEPTCSLAGRYRGYFREPLPAVSGRKRRSFFASIRSTVATPIVSASVFNDSQPLFQLSLIHI